MKKIYIFFFDGFPLARMRRKKMSEKKKKVQAAGWASAHFALDHDIVHCIVTQGAQRARMAWPLERCRDTINCIVTVRRPGR